MCGIVLGAAIFIWAAVPASAEKVNCLDCHKDLTEGKVVHAAVQMGCEICHTGVDASVVPHKFTGGNKGLAAEPPNLCYRCHARADFTKKIVHAPVAAGMCLSCHHPHSGPYDSLLKKAGNQICLQCHSSIDKQPHVMFGSPPQAHPLSGRRDPNREGKPFGCISCHVPHSSDWGKLFRYNAQDARSLCKFCHEFLQ